MELDCEDIVFLVVCAKCGKTGTIIVPTEFYTGRPI